MNENRIMNNLETPEFTNIDFKKRPGSENGMATKKPEPLVKKATVKRSKIVTTKAFQNEAKTNSKYEIINLSEMIKKQK